MARGQVFDFIIVGAGSAGCVLANRLSADPANRVLLLEAGGSDLNLWIRMPIGYGKTFYHPTLNWRYQTEPDAGLAGRPSYWPRGRVIGGSSSINAMVYVRGQHADFDAWAALGNPGWSAADIRARSGSVFHACGTCAMGPDPGRSVVDARLKVHGVEGLRVVDASIFPLIPSGNINAPSIMVGEKGADFILEDWRR